MVDRMFFGNSYRYQNVTSGSRCYKNSMKNSKYVISKKHIQDVRHGRYKNRRRTPKNVQTNHPVVPDTRRHPEEAEKRAKPSVVPYHPGKCRKRPSGIKVKPVSGSLQELRNLFEDVRGTLSSYFHCYYFFWQACDEIGSSRSQFC